MLVFIELFIGLLRAQVLAANAVEEEIDNRSRKEREDLRDDQAADDGDAQRAAQL